MPTRTETRPRSKTAAVSKTTVKKVPVKKKVAPKATSPSPATTAQVLDESQHPAKSPRHKLVRDSFTMPRDEYAAIAELKLRLAKLDRLSKKSDLLRAGIKMLTTLADEQLLGAMQAVPSIKTGRPSGRSKDQKSTKDAAGHDKRAAPGQA